MFFLLFARDSRERIYPRVLYISQNQWEFYLIWRPHSYSIQSGRQHTHTEREEKAVAGFVAPEAGIRSERICVWRSRWFRSLSPLGFFVSLPRKASSQRHKESGKGRESEGGQFFPSPFSWRLLSFRPSKPSPRYLNVHHDSRFDNFM